ncbi:efflux RND transporter permease subunit [Anaerovorax odorimutans]|uniref:efflux RND transporter permease subunit n=1 Tax=Anaerovorax odorimutans TaxID=109327 RepID=UPI0004081E57|nr:efflux RND transporter permease subunit [Anaerovorax odorimutans]
MKNFNLTEWCLNHKQLVYFVVFLTFVMGIFSYGNLGRMEDPEFAVREMYMTVAWPGATAEQVEKQVTDNIERTLQDIPNKDYIRSYSKAGQAIIFIALKDTVPQSQVRDTWVEVRNLVIDMKSKLPSTVQGPVFNDRFDDVYGCIYALTSDGFSYEDMRETAENIRRTFLGVNDVKKVELLGVQSEKVYIKIENSKMASLGITANMISNALATQNTVMPSGMMETSQDNVYVRVSGVFDDVYNIEDVTLKAGGRLIRLGDIAEITRGYSEPSDPKMYYNGEEAIGIAVSMDEGGNIINLGENLDNNLKEIRKDLPAGLEISQVANQPEAVESSVNEFVETLVLAIIIVLIVCFISLGIRTGTVVALCIPLVTAGVLVGMYAFGIPLHKVSLGALIIALGLLVDDEIIAIEMMSVKIDEGWDRLKAGCYAYTSTAFPMLTGTLATCIAFTPVFFSKGPASEYTGSIFSVITMALLLSWVVSVCVTPLLGYSIIQKKFTKDNKGMYNSRFYNGFKKTLKFCLNNRKRVLIITVIVFCFSGFSLTHFVPKEFFPDATRPELIVDLTLPQGSSIEETQRCAQKLSEAIKDDKNIENYSFYVGRSASRFVLSFEPGRQASNTAEFVIVAKDLKAREKVNKYLDDLFANGFESVNSHIRVIQNGPPSAYPVMLRISGNDVDTVKDIANQVRKVMEKDEDLYNVNLDWYEKIKVMHVEIDQNKIKELELDSQQISGALQAQISGKTVSQFREDDKTVDIVLKEGQFSTSALSNLENLSIPIASGSYVPLTQVAKISFDTEDGMIARRNLKPTITAQAQTVEGVTGDNAAENIYEEIKEIRNNLPKGYTIEIGGSLERSDKGLAEVMKVAPMMILGILLVLMLQLQKVSKLVVAMLTAPLCIIGVNIGLLLFNDPFGFVAKLGVLALFGITMRNSVVLIEQVDEHLNKGEDMWHAVINAAVVRFRPVMLTTASTILGLIPLIPNLFWGPMAVAMSFGIFIATLLTLLILPAIYAVVYNLPKEEPINMGEELIEAK